MFLRLGIRYQRRRGMDYGLTIGSLCTAERRNEIGLGCLGLGL